MTCDFGEDQSCINLGKGKLIFNFPAKHSTTSTSHISFAQEIIILLYLFSFFHTCDLYFLSLSLSSTTEQQSSGKQVVENGKTFEMIKDINDSRSVWKLAVLVKIYGLVASHFSDAVVMISG
ncbi:hypothetical protein P8452_49939 [Trifolium repens]|nr:hypothetical protein P8452_49939 [Trifolium repens]